VPSELGELLTRSRTKRGWSLRDVERMTRVKNAHLSQIEKGTIERPSVSILWTLANTYQLDFTRLMRLAGHTEAKGTPGSRRSLVGTALHTIGDLSSDEEKELLGFMEQLRKRRRRTYGGG